MEISDEFAHAIFRNSIFQDTLAQSIKKTIAAVPKQEQPENVLELQTIVEEINELLIKNFREVTQRKEAELRRFCENFKEEINAIKQFLPQISWKADLVKQNSFLRQCENSTMEENLDEPEVTTLKKIVEDLQMNLKDPTNSMGLDTQVIRSIFREKSYEQLMNEILERQIKFQVETQQKIDKITITITKMAQKIQELKQRPEKESRRPSLTLQKHKNHNSVVIK